MGSAAVLRPAHVWIKQDKLREGFLPGPGSRRSPGDGGDAEGARWSTFGNTVSGPAWKKKPTWYQVSISDRMIHLAPAGRGLERERVLPLLDQKLERCAREILTGGLIDSSQPSREEIRKSSLPSGPDAPPRYGRSAKDSGVPVMERLSTQLYDLRESY